MSLKRRSPALEEAITRAGGVTKLAAAMTAEGCKITKAAVCLWDEVPALRVRLVSKITGVAMRRLRPDLYA